MVRGIRKSSKVREKSGNFEIICSTHQNWKKLILDDDFDNFWVIVISYNPVFLIYLSLLLILKLKNDLKHNIWSHMTYVIT